MDFGFGCLLYGIIRNRGTELRAHINLVGEKKDWQELNVFKLDIKVPLAKANVELKRKTAIFCSPSCVQSLRLSIATQICM